MWTVGSAPIRGIWLCLERLSCVTQIDTYLQYTTSIYVVLAAVFPSPSPV